RGPPSGRVAALLATLRSRASRGGGLIGFERGREEASAGRGFRLAQGESAGRFERAARSGRRCRHESVSGRDRQGRVRKPLPPLITPLGRSSDGASFSEQLPIPERRLRQLYNSELTDNSHLMCE